MTEMIPVESSNIAAYGYDADNNILTVEFISRKEGVPNTQYEYYAVPVEVWEAFQAAESKGKFFHAEIKDGYDYVRQV